MDKEKEFLLWCKKILKKLERLKKKNEKTINFKTS